MSGSHTASLLTGKVVAWTMLVVTALMLASLLVIPEATLRLLLIAGVVNFVGVAALYLNRRGRPREAGWILVSGLICLTAGLSHTGGGITSPALIANVVVVMVAGLLLGERATLLFGAIAGCAGFALAALEVRGNLPPSLISHTPFSFAMAYLVTIGLVIAIGRLAARSSAETLDHLASELRGRLVAQEERDRALADTRERVKELALLYFVSRLLQPDQPFDRDLLERIVTRIPQAWRYGEICEARIVWKEIEVSTPGWKETPWRIMERFGGEGTIEVVYREEPPASDEGPFLSEERELLSGLGDLFGTHIAQQRAELERRDLESQLRRSQKMQALGTLAGGIAHDFNNLLTAIRANVELAAADLDDAHPAMESVSEVARAGARATDLVRRILLFSRQEEGEFRAMMIPPVVEDATRLLQAGAPPGIEIRLEAGTDIPAIVGDSSQLHQVLMNLGTNAIHAMAEGGGVLSFEVDRVLRSPVSQGGGLGDLPRPHVYLVVRDTGSGMSQEVMDRIFEPFFTTKGPEIGTGLGLSVVHGIVAAHGGTIGVESSLGGGTSFHLLFPATEGATTEVPTEGEVVEGIGERILYVDDDETLVFVMSRILRRLRYEPRGYSDPHAAIQAFRTNPHDFDGAVVDFRMPEMEGSRLIDELRKIRPDLPVAITSGFRGDEGLAGNTWEFIAKPSTLEELSHSLRRILARR